MTPPLLTDPHALSALPERSLLVVLDHTLTLTARILREQHPTLDDETQPLRTAPPSLLLARLLLIRIDDIQRLLHRYHRAAGDDLDLELPF